MTMDWAQQKATKKCLFLIWYREPDSRDTERRMMERKKALATLSFAGDEDEEEIGALIYLLDLVV